MVGQNQKTSSTLDMSFKQVAGYTELELRRKVRAWACLGETAQGQRTEREKKKAEERK